MPHVQRLGGTSREWRHLMVGTTTSIVIVGGLLLTLAAVDARGAETESIKAELTIRADKAGGTIN